MSKRKYTDWKSAIANDDTLDDIKFSVGDFVKYTSQTGKPEYNCFATVKYISGDKVTLDILCKVDRNSDISNIADENNQKQVNISAIQPAKLVLRRKIADMKDRLARLEQLQNEV